MKNFMRRLLASLWIFVSGAWLSYIGLFTWTRPTWYIACKVLAPLGQMLFFVYLGMAATGRETAPFYIVGNALQMASSSGIFGMTLVVGGERNAGTLLYLIGSPANRLSVFLGRALFNILDGMLTVLMCFLWGVLLGLNLSAANLPGLCLTILIVTASTCGLGLLMGSLSLVSLNVMFINNTTYFLLMLFSGANLALDRMPAWLQAISAGLPLSRGIRAARLLVTGASIGEVWPLLAGELAVGMIYTLAGLALFHWFELQARHRGTLEAF